MLNNQKAAEILRDAVRSESRLPEKDFDGSISFVNNVIGKMSGIITDPGEIRQLFALARLERPFSHFRCSISSIFRMESPS